MPYASSPLLYPLAGRKNQNAKRNQSPWIEQGRNLMANTALKASPYLRKTAEWTNQKVSPWVQNAALQAYPIGNTLLNQGSNFLQSEVAPRAKTLGANAALQAYPIGNTVLNQGMNLLDRGKPQDEFKPFNPANPDPSRAMAPSSEYRPQLNEAMSWWEESQRGLQQRMPEIRADIAQRRAAELAAQEERFAAQTAEDQRRSDELGAPPRLATMEPSNRPAWNRLNNLSDEEIAALREKQAYDARVMARSPWAPGSQYGPGGALAEAGDAAMARAEEARQQQAAFDQAINIGQAAPTKGPLLDEGGGAVYSGDYTTSPNRQAYVDAQRKALAAAMAGDAEGYAARPGPWSGTRYPTGRSTWDVMKERFESDPESKEKWDAYQARRTGQKDERQAAVTARARQRAGLPSMLDVAIQERIRTNKPLTPAMEEYVKQRNMPKGGDADKAQLLRMQIDAQREQARLDREAQNTRFLAEKEMKEEELGLSKEELAFKKKQAEEERKLQNQVTQQQKTVSQLTGAIAKRDTLLGQVQELRVNNLPVQDDLINELNKAEQEVERLNKKVYGQPASTASVQGQPQGVASAQPEPFMPVAAIGGEPDSPQPKERWKSKTNLVENPSPFIVNTFGEAPTAEDVGSGLSQLGQSDFDRGYPFDKALLGKDAFKDLKNLIKQKDETDPLWDDNLGDSTLLVDAARNAKSPRELAGKLYEYALERDRMARQMPQRRSVLDLIPMVRDDPFLWPNPMRQVGN